MKAARGTIILVFAGMVAGGVFGYLSGGALKGHSIPRSQEPWLIAVLIGSLFLAIALHELGHVIGGLTAGMRFGLYVAGPVKVTRENGRLRVTLNRNISLAGGMAAMYPRDISDLRGRILRMVAAGPGASVIWALLCAWAAVGWGDHPLLRLSAMMAGFISGAIALATAIPVNVGAFHSDGSRILMLLKGGFAAERWIALVSLMGQSMAGVRPRNLNMQLVELAAHDSEANYDSVSGALTAYQAYLDRGEIDAAASRLDWVILNRGAWPKAFQPILFSMAAFFEARFRGDALRAREHLELAAAPSGLPLKRSLLLAEAATLQVEGRLEEAREKADQGLKVKGDRTGGHILEEEWLGEIAQATTRQPTTVAR